MEEAVELTDKDSKGQNMIGSVGNVEKQIMTTTVSLSCRHPRGHTAARARQGVCSCSMPARKARSTTGVV